MTVFESKALINKPATEVYAFLSDMNNHRQLMPENVTGWSSTTDQAQFTIQNMGSLSLKISNKIPDSTIIIIPAQQTPFGIELRWVLAAIDNDNTEAILTISAQLNMMMKMLASGPLQKLANQQVEKLKSII